MSNQEMQFNDPNWHSLEQRNMNADPREQGAYTPQPINQNEHAEWQIPPRSQQDGYVGGPHYDGPQPQKISAGEFSGSRSRRGGPWFLFIIVLIFLAILGARSGLGPDSHMRGFDFSRKPVDARSSRLFPITDGNPQTVVINNDAGTIHVNVGSANDSVFFDVVGQSNDFPGNPQDAQVNYGQKGDTITANVANGENHFNSSSIELDVTVPANTNLQLKTNTGEIDVNGVNGKLSLTTNMGSINATGDTLSDQSSLSTNAGSITFDGSINPNGTSTFQTDTGSVDVTLPANASFHLDATSDTGSISGDFLSQNNETTGNQVHTNVGSSSSTEVNIKTGTGSITLNKR